MDGTRHILIVGQRGVGKSTLIEKLLSASSRPRYGFITKMRSAGEDGFRPVYIHPAGQPAAERVYAEENCVGVCDSRTHRPHPDVFNTLGVRYIQEARPNGILVMDELGFFEARADAFTAAVLEALSGDVPVLAAVKDRSDVPFLNAVRSAPKAEVFCITPENRDELYETLLPRVQTL
jgi:nucleoside-triphosphatase